MVNKKLNGADFLLLLLYLNEKSPIYGAIRLIKMMFLFNEEISKQLKTVGLECSTPPKFYAYNYGPFSKDVYEQIELFKGIGFVKTTNINAKEEMAEVDDWEEDTFVDEMSQQDDVVLNRDGKYMKYEIAATGSKYVEEKILCDISDAQKDLLTRFKLKIISQSPKQILKYVYKKYPQYTENSLIKDEVLGYE